jgi:hypothetical protein
VESKYFLAACGLDFYIVPYNQVFSVGSTLHSELSQRTASISPALLVTPSIKKDSVFFPLAYCLALSALCGGFDSNNSSVNFLEIVLGTNYALIPHPQEED